MKSTGTTLWQTPNTAATNSSGFNGLPGGQRVYDEYEGVMFISKGNIGIWWSSSENDTTNAFYNYLSSDYGGANWGGDYYKKNGLSVRCLSD